MIRLPGAFFALVFLLRAFVPAADAEPLLRNPFNDPWIITVGAEMRVVRPYEGDNTYVFRALPLFDVRRAGTARHFSSPRDGISVEILEFDKFRAGPTLKIRFPRRSTDQRDLQDLGSVGFAFEVGGFVEYWPAQWLRTRAEVRQGFGGHHGVVADLSSDIVLPVSPQWTLSGGPRAIFGDDDAVSPYFSITPAQSATSGLPVFTAKGGLKSYGAGVQTRYEWSAQWASHVFVEYDRLTGNVANSPLILQRGSPNQLVSGVGVTYSFETAGFSLKP